MKFLRRLAAGVFFLSLLGLLAACGASPKSKAADWANRFPAEIGDFELQEDRLELTMENPSPSGHVTLTYLNKDDLAAHITIEVYATETAAEVELASRQRNWELQGVRFDRERVSGEPMDVATMAGGYLAYFSAEETLISLTVIPPVDEESAEGGFLALPEDDLETILELIVGIAELQD